MSPPVQLAFPLDPLDDEPDDAVRQAVEARVVDDDHRRSREATPAPTCRCRRSWPMGPDARCCKCGKALGPRREPQKGRR